MPKFLFELVLFMRARLQSVWAQILFDWVIDKAKDEWLEYRIQKHENAYDRIKLILELERKRREDAKRS